MAGTAEVKGDGAGVSKLVFLAPVKRREAGGGGLRTALPLSVSPSHLSPTSWGQGTRLELCWPAFDGAFGPTLTPHQTPSPAPRHRSSPSQASPRWRVWRARGRDARPCRRGFLARSATIGPSDRSASRIARACR